MSEEITDELLTMALMLARLALKANWTAMLTDVQTEIAAEAGKREAFALAACVAMVGPKAALETMTKPDDPIS